VRAGDFDVGQGAPAPKAWIALKLRQSWPQLGLMATSASFVLRADIAAEVEALKSEADEREGAPSGPGLLN
jgi:hypothetical protein